MFIVQTVLECYSGGIRIEHDVRVGCIMVHVDIELTAMAVPEWVTEVGVPPYPVAKFNDGRFIRGEIDEAVSELRERE